jgi:hypothetical protein
MYRVFCMIGAGLVLAQPLSAQESAPAPSTAAPTKADDYAHLSGIDILPTRHAVEPYAELRVGLFRTDNVFRAPTNERDSTIYSIGTALDLVHDGRRLDAAAQGDLDWLNYGSNTYPDHLFGYLDGMASWTFSDAFLWRVRDTFGQLVPDPFEAVTPENIENFNYLSTGPTLTLQLGSSDRVTVYGDFARVTYEEEARDGDILSGGAAYDRQLGARSSVGLNFAANRYNLDEETLASDYETRMAFVRFSGQGARTRLMTDLGATELEQAGTKSRGVLARIEVSRRLSPASTGFLRAGREFSGAGDSLRGSIGASGLGTPVTGIATTDPARQTYGGIGWEYGRGRTAFGLNARWEEADYERNTIFNNTLKVVSGSAERRMGPTLTLNLRASYLERDFDSNAIGNEELEGGLELRKLLGRSIAVALSYEYNERSSSDASTEYKENRLGLRVDYRFAGTAAR